MAPTIDVAVILLSSTAPPLLFLPFPPYSPSSLIRSLNLKKGVSGGESHP